MKYRSLLNNRLSICMNFTLQTSHRCLNNGTLRGSSQLISMVSTSSPRPGVIPLQYWPNFMASKWGVILTNYFQVLGAHPPSTFPSSSRRGLTWENDRIWLPSLKLTVRPWQWMFGIRSFPFGARPIFKCEAVGCREARKWIMTPIYSIYKYLRTQFTSHFFLTSNRTVYSFSNEQWKKLIA